MDGNLIFKDESYAIIGRCMEVHKVLGAGFLEEVYKEALEAKAVSSLTAAHLAQALNYLKATGCQFGLLVNFGEDSFRWHRVVHTSSISNNSSRQSVESASIRVLNSPQKDSLP